MPLLSMGSPYHENIALSYTNKNMYSNRGSESSATYTPQVPLSSNDISENTSTCNVKSDDSPNKIANMVTASNPILGRGYEQIRRSV